MNHIHLQNIATHAIGATIWATSTIFNIASTGITTTGAFVGPALAYTANAFVEQLQTIPNQDRETLGFAAAVTTIGAGIGAGMYIGKKASYWRGESARKKRCINSVADENIHSKKVLGSIDPTTTTTTTLPEARNNDDNKDEMVDNSRSENLNPIAMAERNKRETELIISQLREQLDKKTKECEILVSEAKKRMCDGETKLQEKKGKQTGKKVDMGIKHCRATDSKFTNKEKYTAAGVADSGTAKEVDLEKEQRHLPEIKKFEEVQKIAEGKFSAEELKSNSKMEESRKNQLDTVEVKGLEETKKIPEKQSPAKKQAIMDKENPPDAQKAQLEKNNLGIVGMKHFEEPKETPEAGSSAGTLQTEGNKNEITLTIGETDDVSPTQPLVKNDEANKNTHVTQNIVLSNSPKATTKVTISDRKTNDGSSTIKKSVKSSAGRKSAFLTTRQNNVEKEYRDPKLPANYDFDVSADSSDESDDEFIVDLTNDGTK